MLGTIKSVMRNLGEMKDDMEQGEWVGWIATQLGFKSVEEMLMDYALLRQQHDRGYAMNGPKCCPNCNGPTLKMKTDGFYCPTCNGPTCSHS